MRELIHRIQEFNSKYKSLIVDQKAKPGTLDKIFKFLGGSNVKPALSVSNQSSMNQKNQDISSNKNISDIQIEFMQVQNEINIFKILDKNLEIKSNSKKTFLQEQHKLVTESENIRKNYSIKMQNCVSKIKDTMDNNLEQMIKTYEKFY